MHGSDVTKCTFPQDMLDAIVALPGRNPGLYYKATLQSALHMQRLGIADGVIETMLNIVLLPEHRKK